MIAFTLAAAQDEPLRKSSAPPNGCPMPRGRWQHRRSAVWRRVFIPLGAHGTQTNEVGLNIDARAMAARVYAGTPVSDHYERTSL